MGNHESKYFDVTGGKEGGAVETKKKNNNVDDVGAVVISNHQQHKVPTSSNNGTSSNGIESQPVVSSASGMKKRMDVVVTTTTGAKTTTTTTTTNNNNSNGGFETKSLKELGFEFRFTPHDVDQNNVNPSSLIPTEDDNNNDDDMSKEPSLTWTLDSGEGTIRLYRNDTLVTPDLLDTLIPRGNFFDHVSLLCQRVAQTKLVQDLPIDIITLYGNVQALVSRDLCSMRDGLSTVSSSSQCPGHQGRADITTTMEQSTSKNRHRPTLIVMTGKGISRAGLLSVKQLLTAGMEHGSAAYHIHQAIQRGWHVIVLDPNAMGPRSGMDVITKSLDVLLFFDQRPESISNQIGNNIYFLCHSASGGYLVRYLLLQDQHFQRRVTAIAFSDSTHRLSWAAKDDFVHTLLQSNKVLYIRNNSLGRDYPFPPHQQPCPGQIADVDDWWTHRYGNLSTVWAGTSDHSLVCWTARKVIWAFFDGESVLDDLDHDEDGTSGRRPRNPLEGFAPI